MQKSDSSGRGARSAVISPKILEALRTATPWINLEFIRNMRKQLLQSTE